MHKRQHQQLMSSINNTSVQIQNLLLSRKRIFQSSYNLTINARPEISQEYSRQILAHCAQYSKIKNFVQQTSKNTNYLASLNSKGAKFWEINEKTQRELERKLKSLKQIDNFIDSLIEDEMSIAGEIQQTEETIRYILGKKQSDHINKAEPHFLKKENLYQKLNAIKQRKESVKEQKLQDIKQILQILYSMKKLREERLDECKQKGHDKDSIALMECLTKDLDQMIRNKQSVQNQQKYQDKLINSLAQSNQKVSKLTSELFQTFQTQLTYFQQLYEIFKQQSQLSFFNDRLVNFFEVPEDKLFSLNEGIEKFIENESEKASERKQIQQGISTTQDTIQIFDNLSHNIQSQTLRKKQLSKRISKLHQFRENQLQRREAISQKEGDIAKIKQQCARMEKLLEAKAQQADVKGYRAVHSDMDRLEKQIKKDYSELERLKALKRESAKKIYTETNDIQEQYKDLLSQMLPHIWFRDHDFTKQETISDLDMYLGKLFSRLKILG